MMETTVPRILVLFQAALTVAVIFPFAHQLILAALLPAILQLWCALLNLSVVMIIILAPMTLVARPLGMPLVRT
jgi:hypothetical protein